MTSSDFIQSEMEEKVEKETECSICKEILYDPRTFGCGHSICAVCSCDHTSFCPECKWKSPGDSFVLIKNYYLASIIATLKPEAYERRRKEKMPKVWMHDKRRSLPGFFVRFQNVDTDTAFKVAQKIDERNLWLRESAERLAALLSETCAFTIQEGDCNGFTDYGRFSVIHFSWKNGTLIIFNSGKEWLRPHPESL